MIFLWTSIIGAAVIVAASLFRRPQQRYEDVLVALVLIGGWFLASIPAAVSASLRPHTVDALLYRIDLFFGLDPLALARLTARHRWLWWLEDLSYIALPVVIAGAYAAERSRKMLAV